MLDFFRNSRPLTAAFAFASLTFAPIARIGVDSSSYQIVSSRLDANNNVVVSVVDPNAKLTGAAYIALGDTPLSVVSATVTRTSGTGVVGTIVAKLPAGIANGRYLVSVLWGHDSDVAASLDIGVRGATGATGPQGPKGATGPMGPAGPAGAPGAAGAAGGAGVVGAVGPQGLAGVAGPTGDKGAPGVTGAAGAIGPIGAVGAVGAVGPAGPSGDAGPRGVAGPVGAKGPAGVMGPDGPIGAAGAAGAEGAEGTVGVKGPRGGVGAIGQAGDAGPAGIAGAAGDKGAPGRPGATGPRGPKGAAGPDGPVGATGATGPAGPAGAPENLSDLQTEVDKVAEQLTSLRATIRPRAPTNVSVSVATGQAVVSFTPGADNGAAPTTSYTVTARPGGLTATGARSPITVTGLTPGVTYTFTVVANNPAGASASSAATTSVVSGTAPGAPTQVVAVAGNGAAQVSFNPPANTGGSPITSYVVTSNPLGRTGSGSSSPIVVSGLTNGGSYTFTVTATNALGTSVASASSNPVVPKTVPNSPTNVVAVRDNIIAGRASVSFTSPTNNGGAVITSYRVTSAPGVFSSVCAASPCNVSGLSLQTAYTFTVVATNSVGSSASSAASNAIGSVLPPGPPTITGVAQIPGGIVVSFVPSAPTSGLPISGYVATANPSGQAISARSGPITFTNLIQDQYYTFTVTATNAAGTSAASAPSTPITPGRLKPENTILLVYDIASDWWINAWTGNLYDESNGRELDPLTGEEKIAPYLPGAVPSSIRLDVSADPYVTFDGATQRYTTYRGTYLGLNADDAGTYGFELDRNGNPIGLLDLTRPIYAITAEGYLVDLLDPYTTLDIATGVRMGIMVDPRTYAPVGGGVPAEFHIHQTPSAWRL